MKCRAPSPSGSLSSSMGGLRAASPLAGNDCRHSQGRRRPSLRLPRWPLTAVGIGDDCHKRRYRERRGLGRVLGAWWGHRLAAGETPALRFNVSRTTISRLVALRYNLSLLGEQRIRGRADVRSTIARGRRPPQVLEGEFFGSFDIHLADIENFYHLVEQRNTEQNTGRLIQFSTKIMYQDSISVEVELLAGLRLYSEVKPLVSVGVILTWVYLMTFRDSAVPEKQQIEIRIHTRPVRSHTMEMPSFRDAISGKISYRISYTAQPEST